jgi:hypothetical protein
MDSLYLLEMNLAHTTETQVHYLTEMGVTFFSYSKELSGGQSRMSQSLQDVLCHLSPF